MIVLKTWVPDLQWGNIRGKKVQNSLWVQLKIKTNFSGVVLVEPEYLKDRKVYGHVLAAFRWNLVRVFTSLINIAALQVWEGGPWCAGSYLQEGPLPRLQSGWKIFVMCVKGEGKPFASRSSPPWRPTRRTSAPSPDSRRDWSKSWVVSVDNLHAFRKTSKADRTICTLRTKQHVLMVFALSLTDNYDDKLLCHYGLFYIRNYEPGNEFLLQLPIIQDDS